MKKRTISVVIQGLCLHSLRKHIFAHAVSSHVWVGGHGGSRIADTAEARTAQQAHRRGVGDDDMDDDDG